MGKYGQSAITAVQMIQGKQFSEPLAAWNEAVATVFPGRTASQKKGCPKGAFLGLCEEGLVAGVQPGSYTRSILNKQYAVAAVNILRNDLKQILAEDLLWKKVMAGQKKKHNGQMDVVLSLWESGLIVR